MARLISLVNAGLVSLDDFAVSRFGLTGINEAVTHAAANAGPIRMTIIEP